MRKSKMALAGAFIAAEREAESDFKVIEWRVAP